jgi:integrase
MTINQIIPGVVRSIKRSLSADTGIRYLPIIASFGSQFGDAPVDSLKPRDIEDFVLAGDPMPSTARVRASAVSKIFDDAIRNGEIDFNPCSRLRLPMPKPKKVTPYTADEIGAILDAAAGNDRGYAMVSLLMHTGLRIRDVVTLRRSSLRGEEIHVNARKNGREIRLPIPKDLAITLRRIPATSDYFFWTGESDVHTAVRNAQRRLAGIFNEAQVEGAYAHRSRHTLATRILEHPGATMQDVADTLGITLKVAESRYAKWSESRNIRVSGAVRRAWA